MEVFGVWIGKVRKHNALRQAYEGFKRVLSILMLVLSFVELS